jgi:hypothetical protein
MVKMIAKTRFTYAGMNLRVGDSFLASDKDAKLLQAIKKAELAPVPVPPAIVRAKPVEVVLTEVSHSLGDVEIGSAVAAPVVDEYVSTTEIPYQSPSAPAKKRTYTYKRKDMRAETDE